MDNKEGHSSSFYFTNDTTVVNYIPKKNKNILISTLHHDNEVSNRNDKEPQSILDYNSTKGVVDTLDQVTSTYTCKRKTNRSPVILLYNILDVSAYLLCVDFNKLKLEYKQIDDENILTGTWKIADKGTFSIKIHFPRTEDAL